MPEQAQHLNIFINSQPIPARQGQTLAAALLAAGWRILRHSPGGDPRGLFCGMGVCFECQVTVDGTPGQRACLIPVRPGMRVSLPTGREVSHGDH